MKKKLFVINGNKITLYPNVIWKKAGYLLLIIFPCLCLGFFAALNLWAIQPVISIIVTVAVSVLPFFYLGSKQVIIDGDTQTVYYQSWFGKGRTFSFNDIENVGLMNQLSYGAISGAYYRLNLKKNPYGKGIQLSMGFQKTAKPFIDFEKTIIPFIKNRLAVHQQNSELDYEQNTIETVAAGFTMFRQQGEIFISKPLKIINLIIAVILFGLGLLIIIAMANNNQFKKEYYGLFAFVACIVNFGIWGERVVINSTNNTIEKSYLGFVKKTYSYQYFLGFSTLRHLTGFGSNGIDIIIEIKNTTTQKVTLFSKISSKKVPVIMQELKQILAI